MSTILQKRQYRQYQVIGYREEPYEKVTCEGRNLDFTWGTTNATKYILLLKLFKLLNGDKTDKNYELALWEEEDQCSSGWTNASYGLIKLKQVVDFGFIPYIPKDKNATIEIDASSDDIPNDISNDFFIYSNYGDDKYYPTGYVKFYTNMFIPNAEPADIVSKAEIEETEEVGTEETEEVGTEEVGTEETEVGARDTGLVSVPATVYSSTYKDPRNEDRRTVWVFHGDSVAGKSYLSSLLKDMPKYETDIAQALPSVIETPIIVIGNKWKHTVDDVIPTIKDRNNTKIVLVNFKKLN